MYRQTQVRRSGRVSAHGAAQQRWLVWLASLLLSTGLTANVQPQSQAAQPQAATAPVAAKNQGQVRDLVYGQAIARELAGGEVHAYRMTLVVGQFLHIVVEQRGIDVVVRVFGPDGKQVAEVDSPNGEQGPEPVYVVTEASGSYRVEVRSLEKQASGGGYEISIKEVRAATAQDGSRIAAQKAYAAGEQARVQGTKASLEEAIKEYEQALLLYKAAGDRNGEAITLTSIGDIYALLGEKQKALAYFNLALPLCKALGDRTGEARALNNLGGAYDSLGEKQKALDHYNLSLTLWKAIGDRKGEAVTLSNIGFVYDSLGEKQKALDYLTLALPLCKAGGDRKAEAYTLNGIGAVYDSLGEQQKALAYYNLALPLFKAVSDRNGEARTLNNIGFVYDSLAEKQKALDFFNRALLLWKAAGDRNGEAFTLTNIGRVYDSLGEKRKALAYFNLALPLRKAVGSRRGEAITLNNIGGVYDSLGEKEKALAYYNLALSLWKAVGDPSGEVDTLRNIARVERDMGRLTLALDTIKAAIPLIEFIRTNVRSQDLRSTFFATVQDHYELYIDILMRLHLQDPTAGYAAQALQANERAHARSLVDLLAESRADIRQGVDPVLLERERRLQQLLSAKAERQTRLLSGPRATEQSVDFATEIKALAKEIPELTTEYQQVEAQIRVTSPRYAQLTQPQALSLQEIQQMLDSGTLLLEFSLGEDRSYLWAVTETSLKSYELPGRAEIGNAARRFIESLTARSQSLENESLAQRTARLERADDDYSKAAASLSRMLLKDAHAELGDKRLLIIADGALQYVPFAALPNPVSVGEASDSVQPLVTKHEIVSLPSISTLAVLRREMSGRKPPPKTVAVLADPVFDRDDPRLSAGGKGSARRGAKAGRDQDAESHLTSPDSQQSIVISSASEVGLTDNGRFPRLLSSRLEAEAIAATTSAGQAMKALDFNASRATVTGTELSQYRIVHIATHGLLNNLHPELSGIVLSLVDEQGRPQNGFLRLHEIYNLNLPVDMVVLSACQTGLGKEIRGEGLVGLTRGFMYAGAPRVVASLWKVEDAATAELMKRFYTGMLREGRTPSAALRAAQVSLRQQKRWQSPFYWAAFVLQGEWK